MPTNQESGEVRVRAQPEESPFATTAKRATLVFCGYQTPRCSVAALDTSETATDSDNGGSCPNWNGPCCSRKFGGLDGNRFIRRI